MGYLQYKHVTAVWTILPFIILVLLYMIMKGLDVCIKANDYLFAHTERLLLDWQDEAVNPETSYGDDVDGGIGWVWDHEKDRSMKLSFKQRLEQDNSNLPGAGAASRHVQ